jgi:high-affinity nickel-transport protein
VDGVLVGGLLGLANGARHALEPDHVAVVVALVAEQRSARASLSQATAWGVGHGLSMAAVAVAASLFHATLPSSARAGFELCAALMLVFIGGRTAWQAWRAGAQDAPAPVLRRWPLLVGVVHGLAGSGLVSALVLGNALSPTRALALVALYAFGAAGAMAAVAGVLGAPLAELVRRPRARRGLMGAAGLASVAVGVAWGLG